MKIKILLLLLFIACINAAAQPTDLKLKQIVPATVGLKKMYEYSFKISNGKLLNDSVLSGLVIYDKRGKEVKNISYDTAGKKEFMSVYSEGFDKNNNRYYRVEHCWRFDEYVNFKKTFRGNDTGFYKPGDRFHYRNTTGEQETRTTVFNDKGALTEVETVYRYNYGEDLAPHPNFRFYYSDSVLVKRVQYDPRTHKPGWVTIYTWDNKRNLTGSKVYEINKMDTPKIATTNYYDPMNRLYRVEDSTYITYEMGGVEIGFFMKEDRVHNSYYKEYDEKGMLSKESKFSNGVLVYVKRYKYKYY
ncbi:hypothetical protein [Ferruginibacter sp.]